MNNRRADLPLWWLAVLTLSLAVLGVVIGRLQDNLLPQIISFCERSWREATEHAWLSGLGSLPLILGFSLMRGLRTAIRVVRDTQRWVTDLGDQVFPDKRLARIAHEAGLEGHVHLVSDARLYAVTVGLWRPRVLMSTAMVALLDDGELHAILTHERHHVMHRDPLKVWLAYTLTDALFFLPLARDLREAYMVRKELSADRDVIGSPRQKQDLARALLKLLDTDNAPSRSAIAVGQFSPARARLAQLTGEGASLVVLSRRRLAQSLIVGLAMLVIVAALFVEPSHAAKMAQCESIQLFTPLPG
jgi:hypothetical protein